MQEGTVTLLLEMAERGRAEVAAKPLRSAEEIAREMVPDAGWLQLGTSGVRLASDVSVPHARAIVAAAIERDRAERQPAQPRDLAGRIRAMILRWSNIWASLGLWDAQTDAAVRFCLEALREAERCARRCPDQRSAAQIVSALRACVREAHDTTKPVYAQAADELEAIVRERAPSEGT